MAVTSIDDKVVFEREALKHLDAVYNFALYLTRKPSEADDLTQETYLRALRFSNKFQLGTHLRAWLFQIARNTFYTFYRIRDREAAVAENGVPDWDTPMFQDAPNYDAQATDVHTDLERAMKRLPEEFRTALLLSEVEGLAQEEVARVMSCPVGTVKSRIFRAKERMRGLLRDYEEEGVHYMAHAASSYSGLATSEKVPQAPYKRSETNGHEAAPNGHKAGSIDETVINFRISLESIDEILKTHHTYEGRFTVASANTGYSAKTIKRVWVANNLPIRKRGNPHIGKKKLELVS